MTADEHEIWGDGQDKTRRKRKLSGKATPDIFIGYAKSAKVFVYKFLRRQILSSADTSQQ